jgi:hypothetical protein
LPTASKKAGQNPPSPELFLEAIEMFLEGEPAKRLDSTPRVRNIVDNGKNAKEKGGGRNQRDDRSTHPFQPETSARGHPNLTRMETSNCLNPLEHNTTTKHNQYQKFWYLTITGLRELDGGAPGRWYAADKAPRS